MNYGQIFLRAINERINATTLNSVRVNNAMNFSSNVVEKSEYGAFKTDAVMCGDKCGDKEKKVRY